MSAKKVATFASAALVAAALGGIGVSAASAATGVSAGCTVTSNVPYQSGAYIVGYGTGSCSTSKARTLFIEVHRSEGWWHPIIATGSKTGTGTWYTTSAAGCDDNNWRFYFSEVSFNGGVEINSGDSSYLRSQC
jgi:hypothetical protein